ncbi:MAG: bifunctional serine/threonine-protein kinase/formylglycine-generating enzyme family protein [Planctomycetota bacterium]
MNAPESEHDEQERLRQARAVFEEYLRRCDEGEIDFETYASSFPDVTRELQTLHEEWRSGSTASHPSQTQHAARLDKLERQRAAGDSRYEARGELGRGGMGRVLEVWDTDLRRALAMKVLHQDVGHYRPGSSDTDQSVVRFLEEAQITAQLDHPGIVPVHELGIDSERNVYFTMGRVKGRTLKKIIEELHAEEGSWSMTRAVGFIVKVCETMAFAHAKGVVHRDLKPTNVMVGRFGAVYVMDWGLAIAKGHEKFAHDIRLRRHPEMSLTEMRTDRRDVEETKPDAPVVTMDGAVLGTPAYMAPEQARGEVENVGPLSDVYAVGAMLYQMLTGRMPYIEPGMRVSPHTVLALVISGPPRPIEELAPRVPAELVAICSKAMAREPEDRYPGMFEFAEDLHAFLEGRVVRAYETGAWAEFRKWVGRNRGLSTALAAALVAGIAGLWMWLYHQQTLSKERFLAADVYRFDYHLARAGELWPASPGMIPEMQLWLDQVEELRARRAEHVARLDDLRRSNLTPAAFAAARESGEWRFDRADLQARHDGLAAMVAGLERLDSDDPEVSVVADVRGRLDFATTVRARSIDDHAAAWDEAVASIADVEECPLYDGLRLEPQLGLVPLGRDPESGLWEFAHLQTGVLPERDFDGTLALEEDSSLVFVLIPGGTFDMGAEPPFPAGRTGPNLDPDAHSYEGPVHPITLAPFFLSKYELTQAQWRRVTGEAPSHYNPLVDRYADLLDADRPWLHPVEYVSWQDCRDVLGRLQLLLPTEAQWERAARGGDALIYAYGDTPRALEHAANLADRTARDRGSQWTGISVWLDVYDGWAIHAPVDEFPPNPYGLHNVHGNVYEWCEDSFVQYDGLDGDPGDDKIGTVRAGDGLREAIRTENESGVRILRGGSFRHGALQTRVSCRYYRLPRYFDYFIGVRPARAVDGLE